MLRLFIIAAMAAVAISLAPRNAGAQILDRIKQQTADKLKDKKKAADEKLLTATGAVVDSIAEKSARGVDSAVTKGSNLLANAVDRTEQGVAAMLKGGGESALAKQVAAGHVTLANIHFADDGTMEPGSQAMIRALAKQLKQSEDMWIIEAHVAAGPGDQALSEHRAKAVKAMLIENGMDAGRVFARGLGATRPAPGAPAPGDRFEIVRMQ